MTNSLQLSFLVDFIKVCLIHYSSIWGSFVYGFSKNLSVYVSFYNSTESISLYYFLFISPAINLPINFSTNFPSLFRIKRVLLLYTIMYHCIPLLRPRLHCFQLADILEDSDLYNSTYIYSHLYNCVWHILWFCYALFYILVYYKLCASSPSSMVRFQCIIFPFFNISYASLFLISDIPNTWWYI